MRAPEEHLASDVGTSNEGAYRLRACWVLALLWLPLFLTSAFMQGSSAGVGLWAAQLILLFVIALLHSSLLYGWLGTCCYVVIGLVVAIAFEASSISFGFPYGSYVHHSPGPRLLQVPLQAAFLYLVYGWYAWTLARLLCLDRPVQMSVGARFLVPLCGGFILAGYDYPIDPIMSSVAGLWTFAEPRGQFGVPLTNFLGWILTGWAIFQPLVFLERRFFATPRSRGKSYWLLPSVIWLGQAVQFVIMWSHAPAGEVNPGGRSFVISDVYEAGVAASLFTVVFVGLLGIARLRRDTESRDV